MKFLVTGASGFIGSHLCETLLAQGHEVIGMDSCIIGRKENIEFLLNCPRFQFIESDLCSGDLPTIPVDGIFHFASPTAPAETYKHPGMTLDVNTRVTEWLLDLAAFYRARFLFASSIKVSDELSFKSTYIAGKREGERLCQAAGAKIARMGNIYGPRMAPDDSRVIPTFCRNIRDGKPISVWGDGQQMDSFCYVDDAIKALTLLMLSDVSGVVEIGDPVGITIERLAMTMIGVLHAQASICYEQPGGSVCVISVDGTMSNNRTTSAIHAKARKVPDIGRAKKELNWSPVISLPTGIRRTYEHYQFINRVEG